MPSVKDGWARFISSIGRRMSSSLVSCSFVVRSHVIVNDYFVVAKYYIDSYYCRSYYCHNFTGCFIHWIRSNPSFSLSPMLTRLWMERNSLLNSSTFCISTLFDLIIFEFKFNFNFNLLYTLAKFKFKFYCNYFILFLLSNLVR